MAKFVTLASTQGSVSDLYVGVSHTNSSKDTMPKKADKKIILKQECARSCVEHMFQFMHHARTLFPNTRGVAWALGGDFNLTQGHMAYAVQTCECKEGTEQTIMLLAEKLNESDGLWVVSGQTARDVTTDGRKGFDNAHVIVVTELQPHEDVDEDEDRRHEIYPSISAAPSPSTFAGLFLNAHFILLIKAPSSRTFAGPRFKSTFDSLDSSAQALAFSLCPALAKLIALLS